MSIKDCKCVMKKYVYEIEGLTERIKILENDIKVKDEYIKKLKAELEQAEKENKELKEELEKLTQPVDMIYEEGLY